jgi:uncharacterized protein
MDGLRFPVDQIPRDGLSGRRTLGPSWFALPPDADDPIHPIVLQEPIEAAFRLEHSGRDVRFHLELRTIATLTCSRCLKAYPFPVESQTRYTFFRAPAAGALKSEKELSLDDLESGTFEGDEIDLSNVIYEQIVLSFPMKPLCHEGCKGLCPRCGIDRNIESCQCDSVQPDPRWDALKKLRLRS